MRFTRTLAAVGTAAVVAAAVGAFAVVGGTGDGPDLDFSPSGCLVKPYEASVEAGWLPWPSAYSRSLAGDGAEYAVLCQMKGSLSSQGWGEALRLTRAVGELEGVIDDLPKADPDGISTLVGFPPVNLVLHYPDGRRTVMSFEFNRNEVSTHAAVRSGAAKLTAEFARLWHAEHSSADPARITPAECQKNMPNPRKRVIEHPGLGIVHGFDYWDRLPTEPRLPSPLAAASACRYTADARGRFVLRAQDTIRTDLEPVRTALNAEQPKELEPPCGAMRGPKLTAFDIVHLTDVTGGTAHLLIARAPCTADLSREYVSGAPVAPEVDALLTRLLP